MALQNLFGEVALETTQEQLLAHTTILLSAILEKMARVDTQDRQAVTIEAGSVGISSNQTLTTLTTAGTLNNLGALGRPADGIPFQMSNIGALHIYNNITVS